MATKRNRNELNTDQEYELPTKKQKISTQSQQEKQVEELDEKSNVDLRFVNIHDFFNSFNNHYQLVDLRNINDFSKSHVIGSIHLSQIRQLENAKYGCDIMFYHTNDCNKDNINTLKIQYDEKSVTIYKLIDNCENQWKINCTSYEILKDTFKSIELNYPFLLDLNAINKNNNRIIRYPNVIIPNKLFIGDMIHRKNKHNELIKLGITHILDACDMSFEEYPLNINKENIYKISIDDNEKINIKEYFENAIDFINKGKHVFVHCQIGVSRSATIIIAYLMKMKECSLFKAYNTVSYCRPIIYPNDGFYKQLLEYELLLFGKSTAVQNESNRLC
eukprot:19110_1